MFPTLPSEIGRLRHVAVTHARDAFVNQATIDGQWQGLGFTARPDFGRAVEQHDALIALLREAGAAVHLLAPGPGTTLDAIWKGGLQPSSGQDQLRHLTWSSQTDKLEAVLQRVAKESAA